MTKERTQLENLAIDVMKNNMQYQDDAMLGFFWYDIDRMQLFGVTSSIAEDSYWYESSQFNKRVRTDRRLHQNIWQKNHHKKQDSRFLGDYTLVPRGRVFEFENDGFKVFTGSWINNHSEVKKLILEEFQLPEDRTEFVQDSHWDIGRGWSQELI